MKKPYTQKLEEALKAELSKIVEEERPKYTSLSHLIEVALHDFVKRWKQRKKE